MSTWAVVLGLVILLVLVVLLYLRRQRVASVKVASPLAGSAPALAGSAPAATAGAAGMVRIPGGTFMMGCPPGDKEHGGNETPVHQVTVNAFWMDAKPVTQAQYQKVMNRNPSHTSGGPGCPVEQVSWADAQSYCAKVGKRLPTEAEWEFAARGGAAGGRHGDLDAVAWHKKNSGGKTHPVGQKQPNAYGLYDMLGNVWEWCADWYAPYTSAPADNPHGPGTGQTRVARGGSWSSDPWGVRACSRFRVDPTHRSGDVGFRCVRD
jgi:formylglycine-generating enzyme required for sulfatase activity